MSQRSFPWMKALIDTGVWFRRFHKLPINQTLHKFLSEVTEWHLSPLSLAEITFKWQRRRLPMIADPNSWIDEAVAGYFLEPVTTNICIQAGLWEWDHGDLVDRLLAATAKETGIPLVHTDTRLKRFPGFPQKYFVNVLL
jgi:PIN domain nuclease of toxin-antitoxin system